MINDPWFYAAAIPAMIVLGLSKGGFATIGLLAVPIMALVISPVQAAGITLPILVLSDIVAVVSYLARLRRATLKIMLPGRAGRHRHRLADRGLGDRAGDPPDRRRRSRCRSR